MLGWIALALATLVTSFYAMFLGGEAAASLVAAQSWQEALASMMAGIPPFVFVTFFVGMGAVAATFRRAGTVYALLGIIGLLFLPGPMGPLQAIPLIISGILYYLGHPEPRRRALRVAVWTPILVALVTAALVAVIPPPG